MAGSSENASVTHSRIAQSLSTRLRSGFRIPTALSVTNKVIDSLKDKLVRKPVANIAAGEHAKNKIHPLIAVEDALTGDSVR